MLFYFHFNYHPKAEVVHAGIEGINYKKLLGLFVSLINTGHRNYTQDNFVSQIKNDLTEDEIGIDDFYYYVLERGKLAPTDKKTKGETPQARAFFLALLHMILLQNSHSTYEGTFSERLVKG